MRLTTILLLVTFMQVSANSFAQKITLNKKNVSLESVLREIRKQSGYDIYYDARDISSDLKISIQVTNAEISEALKSAFNGLPLTFDIDGRIISIKKKATVFAGKTDVAEEIAGIDISGNIKDEKGQPMQAVTVGEKGKDNIVASDAGGNFKIAVSDQNAVLTFSFVGYQRQEIKVGSKKAIHVIMSPNNAQLHDVVVSGYTVQNRADFVGASSHVDGRAIENRPVASFDQALAGQAAGVKMTSNGGSLNATPTFRIRGTNSINLSSYPLIVIDGVTAFNGNVGLSAVVENNPLSSINMSDIESIEVLKDASATAIYGSRAANGVVVITTKKGRLGKTRVAYDAYFGISKKPRLPELLSAADYVTIKTEAQKNSGITPTFFLGKNADGSVQETNWYDYLYQTGHSQNHNLSISGASESTNYFISLNYNDQTGFLVKNTFTRKSARVNLDHLLLKGLRIGTNFSYSDAANNNLNSVYNSFGRNNLARLSMVLPPNVLPYNADGSYNISGNSLGAGPNATLTGYYNPLPIIDNDFYSSASKNFLGLIYAEWELFKGFKVKTNYSLNSLNVLNSNFTNPIQGFGYGSNGSATNENNTNYRTDFTNTINYTASIAKNHHINALAGYEEIHTVMTGASATRTGVIDPFFQTFAGGFTTISDISGSSTENGYRSYFGNVFYDYKKKYLLSASFRRDGFSGLAVNHKYGNFSGGAIGWNLSSEDFYRNSPLA
ncbi:MAG: SusC/RagA family TonB-linked outer membrane protein, partial [Bacteroidetes bacterium]|nr:SusC/RagA family TonB-linked outer membrane protein [Bacteroidota bacterium]